MLKNETNEKKSPQRWKKLENEKSSEMLQIKKEPHFSNRTSQPSHRRQKTVRSLISETKNSLGYIDGTNPMNTCELVNPAAFL